MRKIDIFRALDSFRRQLECPSDHQRDWKSNDDCDHDESHRPVGNFEERKNLCRDLDDQPTDNRYATATL